MTNEEYIKVLEYWYIIEFLTQENFPNENIIRDKFNRALSGENAKNYHSLTNAIQLNTTNYDKNIEDLLYESSKKANLPIWGNLTLYCGRIKREHCINKIIEYIPTSTEDREEYDYSKITLFSMQLSHEGKYIDDTFSLSPIAWAILKLKGRDKLHTLESINYVLNHDNYKNDIEDIEEKFLLNEKEVDEDKINQNKIFSVNAITIDDIRNLYDFLVKKLEVEPDVKKDNFEEIYEIEFSLYKDEETKLKKETDDYNGLDNSYYSQDISVATNLT